MQILNADDPGSRFRHVAVRHKIDVRGEMVITDPVADGSELTAKTVTEVRPFRTRIGADSDAELLKRLEARAGPDVAIDADESVAATLKLMFPMLAMLALVGLAIFLMCAGWRAATRR